MGDYFPTLGVDFIQKDYPKDALYAHFFDFGGASLKNLLQSSFISNTDLFVFVTDKFDEKEYTWMSNVIYQIENLAQGKINSLLVRNKIDLNEVKRMEQTMLGEFMKNYSSNFIQVSAKLGTNFLGLKQMIFQVLAEELEKIYIAGAYFDCEIQEPNQGLY